MDRGTRAKSAHMRDKTAEKALAETTKRATVVNQETSKSHRTNRPKKRSRDTPGKAEKKTSKSAPVIKKTIEVAVDGVPCKVSE